jgi:hypothetical protein
MITLPLRRTRFERPLMCALLLPGRLISHHESLNWRLLRRRDIRTYAWLQRKEVFRIVLNINVKIVPFNTRQVFYIRRLNNRDIILGNVESSDFTHCLTFRRTQCFGTWICFRPQVEGWTAVPLLGPLEGANPSY